MKLTGVKSSQIAAVGYNKQSEVMVVRFHKDGKLYKYTDVPEWTYVNLVHADSVGSFFNRNVRNVFKYQQIIEKQVESL